MGELVLSITKEEMKLKLSYKMLAILLDICLGITIAVYLNIFSLLNEYSAFEKHFCILIINLIVITFILNPLHEYIHYIIIKKYGFNCILEISFLFIVLIYKNGMWTKEWRFLRNSNVQETSGGLFTRNQYIKALIAPFIIISAIYIIFGLISHNFLLMATLIVFNAQLSINDIYEVITLFRYRKNYYVRMFNKDIINRGFEVYNGK